MNGIGYMRMLHDLMPRQRPLLYNNFTLCEQRRAGVSGSVIIVSYQVIRMWKRRECEVEREKGEGESGRTSGANKKCIRPNGYCCYLWQGKSFLVFPSFRYENVFSEIAEQTTFNDGTGADTVRIIITIVTVKLHLHTRIGYEREKRIKNRFSMSWWLVC